MKQDFKILGYILALIIVIVASILVGDKAILPLPAPLPFGLAFIAFVLVMNLFAEICRGKTTHVICNYGHWSLNVAKDIHRIPWQNNLLGKVDEKNKSLGEMTIMFPGGIDKYGFSLRSTKEFPVIIYPSKYEHSEGTNYVIYANLNPRKFSQLSPYIRHVLSYYQKRIGKNTPIFYGSTSHMDGSATPENTKLELDEAKLNELLTNMDKRAEVLYEELRRAGELKEKKVFMGKQVIPMTKEGEP